MDYLPQCEYGLTSPPHAIDRSGSVDCLTSPPHAINRSESVDRLGVCQADPHALALPQSLSPYARPMD